MQFTIRDKSFTLNGEPLQLISGAMHYFRTHPDQWRDRLRKMRACGLNSVETYVAWNLHEPEPGEFCFEGFCDIERFIRIAAEEGLLVIVRPGPFICAEWEGGGFPWWLHNVPDLRLRCYNKPYLDCVDRFFGELLGRLRPLQCTQGGPIIAMQIENEYGSFGNDKRYLQHLQDSMQSLGADVLLFTSDGPEDFMLQGGTLSGVFKTANFGSNPDGAFAKLREYETEGPMMCMEYWNGWFDHWGEGHHTRSAENAAAVLDEMLSAGASVNFYMFHGGTNFGFMNGANLSDTVQPTITSYDYDSPLSEAGDLTLKFEAYREVISKYIAADETVEVYNSAKRDYGEVVMTDIATLEAALDPATWIESAHTLGMEEVGQGYGFILYRTTVQGDWLETALRIRGLHDRAVIMVNGEARGVLERKESEAGVPVTLKAGDQLDILVENLGRVNFGAEVFDRKGIVEHVRFGQQLQFGWRIHTLPLQSVDSLLFVPFERVVNAPAFYRAPFEVDEVADTFLSLEGWTKGVALINGFNLGRYWETGPQKTLYVPAPLLKQGMNELVIFELHGASSPVVAFVDSPMLG